MLNMYLYAFVKKGKGEAVKTVTHWKNHSDLHAIFEEVWLGMNAPKDISRAERMKWYMGYKNTKHFNQVSVPLNESILYKVERVVKTNRLPDNRLFYGSKPRTEQQIQFDLRQLDKAREVIKNGYTVYYQPQWS